MGERLSPIGFWSYARQDDEEKLGQLRVRLSRQLQQQYGRNQIKIFQDVAAIPPGAEWEAKILDALNTSTFFIPIITPNFLESEWCNKEFFVFREREKQLIKDHPELAGHRRIFPIYYVDIDGVKPHDPNLLVELRRLQWLDFQDLIYKDDGSEEVQRRLGDLARSLRQLLHLEVGAPSQEAPPIPPIPPPLPIPPPPKQSFWRRLTTPQKAGLAIGLGVLAIVISGRLSHMGSPKTPLAPPANVGTVATAPQAVDPRLAAAKLMVGTWRDRNSPDGCRGSEASQIQLAAKPAADGAPRLELSANHAIGVLNPDGSWSMDSGIWRYNEGVLELRAEGAPADKFDVLVNCATEGSKR
jgi:hypothetical protein